MDDLFVAKINNMKVLSAFVQMKWLLIILKHLFILRDNTDAICVI